MEQYTVTDNGITAAFVCNAGFLWSDGSLFKLDKCEGAQWRPFDYDDEIWEAGCTGIHLNVKNISNPLTTQKF